MQSRHIQKIIKHLKALELPLNATPADVKKAYHRLSLVLHPDKHPGHEAEYTERFQSISNAYEALCEDEAFQSGKLKSELNKYSSFSTNGESIALSDDIKTVNEYIEKISANCLASFLKRQCRFNKEVDLDTPASFFFYVPIDASSILGKSFTFDPTDFAYILKNGCKGRYWQVFSSFADAISFRPSGQTNDIHSPFDHLQAGSVWDGDKRRYLDLPTLIPTFVIYRLDSITPRTLIHGLISEDVGNLIHYFTEYTTNRLTRITTNIKQALNALETKYVANSCSELRSKIRNTIEQLAGKELRSKEWDKKEDARYSEYESHAIHVEAIDQYLEKCLLGEKASQYWYAERVRRYEDKNPSSIVKVYSGSNHSMTLYNSPPIEKRFLDLVLDVEPEPDPDPQFKFEENGEFYISF